MNFFTLHSGHPITLGHSQRGHPVQCPTAEAGRSPLGVQETSPQRRPKNPAVSANERRGSPACRFQARRPCHEYRAHSRLADAAALWPSRAARGAPLAGEEGPSERLGWAPAGLDRPPAGHHSHPRPPRPGGAPPPPASAEQLGHRGHWPRSVPRPEFRPFRCPPPGAPFRNAVLPHFPFAFSVDLQATAVQNPMERPCGPFREEDFHGSASPGKRGGVRDRQRDSHFLEQGTGKTLCLRLSRGNAARRVRTVSMAGSL